MQTVNATSVFDLATTKRKDITIHPFANLLNWSERQNDGRMLWSAIAITSLGCVFAPIATIFVCLSGMSAFFVVVTMLSMSVTLVVNLAALPTRITIPFFFLSVLIDLAIIVSALAMGCHFEYIFAPY